MNALRVTTRQTDRPWTVKSLRPLPAVAVRLMRLVSTDEVVFQRVADLIRSDPAFSAEVLRVANSPLMGRREEIRGIMHAMAIMGLDRLKGLVMTVALRNFLAAEMHNERVVRCWRHCLAVAVIAEEVAAAGWLEKDQYYTAGLLHDLGRLALLATFPKDYGRLLTDADQAAPGEYDLLAQERTQFSADHTDVGAWLADDWGFPQEYFEVVAGHHDCGETDGFSLPTAIQLSCRLADVLGFQAAGPPPALTIEELKNRFPGCTWERMKPEQELLLSVAGKINALECSLL